MKKKQMKPINIFYHGSLEKSLAGQRNLQNQKSLLDIFVGTLRAMSTMTNKCDGRKVSKGRRSSSSVEEDSGESNMGGEGHLKKGPWTSAEDAILVDYVKKHREGNWNAVQRHSGLVGKSCRIRWANHLRPDLRKGAFTEEEEERRIIELHAKMGNKWARMAAEVCSS
ncbi:transcription factor GAMYB-like isoform X3 [Arachis stenosperma]|uniref:transcription factor GAMYB-like isoform X3 n=1 Tax=Arachis stenosperma TaxID=217475 RepID=UPI0025ACF9BD|nr:transcription factor GAMYB-like isoform X3 [Arachis stenosperma]